MEDPSVSTLLSPARRRCEITRRRFVGSGLALGALVLTGCGSSDEDGPTGSTATQAAAAGPRIAHKWGDTDVPPNPRRVVSVGFTDQDYLLAVGVVPIAVREWFGAKPSATWPWAQDRLKGAKPVVLPRLELDYEQIAALKPDLIVGLYGGMTQEEYGLLSKIAPTVAQPPGDDYALTWQEQTRLTGRIFGKQAQAEQLVGELEQQIAATKADHPQFAGATAVLASAAGGKLYVYGKNTPSLFLTSLGMKLPADVARLTDNPDVSYELSEERLDLVDADLTLWSEAATDPGPKDLLADPRYRRLPVHAEGRDLFLGLDLYNGAFVFSSPLSLPMLLRDVVPAMADAIDGDPHTAATLPEA
jgi:iron complex transport system substrate-binding protein